MKFKKGDKVIYSNGMLKLKRKVYEPGEHASLLYKHENKLDGDFGWVNNNQLELTIEYNRQIKFKKILK